MSFVDVFKKSFLNGYQGDLMVVDILVALGIASLLALYVFFVYRQATRKTFYSKTFNISLAAIAVITTAIILTVQSNIVISLGMVGALSIVRFRTAIKDPMDLAFLFWSISIGIICGAGLAHIAALVSLLLTVGIYVLNKLSFDKAPLMLVVNGQSVDLETKVLALVKEQGGYVKVKSRNSAPDHFDMVAEVRLKDEQGCLKAVGVLPGVHSVSLLSHDGEVTY